MVSAQQVAVVATTAAVADESSVEVVEDTLAVEEVVEANPAAEEATEAPAVEGEEAKA